MVDDEPAIRLLCRVNLELDGYRVLEAATLAEARRLFDEHPVDAVLLDLHLGGEDSHDWLRELDGRTPRVPLAIVTGSGDVELLVAEGADAVLAKPFAIDDLSRTVTALVAVAERTR